MEALGILLPLALAVAFSTVPLTAMIIILLSPRSRRAGPAFLAGTALGTFIITYLFTYGLLSLPQGFGVFRPDAVAVVELVVGVLLIAFGTWSLLRPPVESARRKAWTKRLSNIGPLAAFGVSLALCLRPKALVFGIAAGLAIGGTTSDPIGAAILVLIYTVIGSSTIAIPVLMAWRSPEKMQSRLLRARNWLTRNSRWVSFIVTLMVGVVLVGDALTQL